MLKCKNKLIRLRLFFSRKKKYWVKSFIFRMLASSTHFIAQIIFEFSNKIKYPTIRFTIINWDMRSICPRNFTNCKIYKEKKKHDQNWDNSDNKIFSIEFDTSMDGSISCLDNNYLFEAISFYSDESKRKSNQFFNWSQKWVFSHRNNNFIIKWHVFYNDDNDNDDDVVFSIGILTFPMDICSHESERSKTLFTL